MDDCGTFNKANEWIGRNTNCSGGDEYTPASDELGNLIDDGKDYKYVYDPFGRLRFIKDRLTPFAVREEFTYNGLGYRIGRHYDVDADLDVDGSDVWFYFAYDDAWRIVAAFRSSDTNAKELFVAHMAGMNGRGSSSALDAVVLRDRDANTSWGSSTDGVREERVYHCQNWRGDIVNLLKSTGGTNCGVFEVVRYSSYGVPFGISPGDIEGDGDVDGDDNTNWPGGYTVRCDYDLDGDMDITDQNLTIANTGRVLGRGTLSHSSVGNRKGYCGYEHDGVIDTIAHVRNRVLLTELGRWSSRDPLGYVDGESMLQYSTSHPISKRDTSGLATETIDVPLDDINCSSLLCGTFTIFVPAHNCENNLRTNSFGLCLLESTFIRDACDLLQNNPMNTFGTTISAGCCPKSRCASPRTVSGNYRVCIRPSPVRIRTCQISGSLCFDISVMGTLGFCESRGPRQNQQNHTNYEE